MIKKDLQSLPSNPENKSEIPDTPEGRIAELMKLSLNEKKHFVPDSGYFFHIGPYIFKVTVTNPSQLRFTAKLADVVIEGVNDGKSKIINPHTGEQFNLTNTNKIGD